MLHAFGIGLYGSLIMFCFIGWPLLVLAWSIEKHSKKE